ncbi:hypothetical protein CVT24_008753 [Panaeolus cyanescens]|uniref:Protein SQS1 n=1 Tax=Panaeolus cyanescens TaxID=181874 RepID=A0A409YX38_9AGAR|nr:hypothetical protein CVT24_008753 [Panaeolus cyanescens]
MAKKNGNRGRGQGTFNTNDGTAGSSRGRGGGGPGRGRGRGRGGPSPKYNNSFIHDELDFTVQMFADAPNAGPSTPRGRGGYGWRGRGGRGRGGQFNQTHSGTNTPVGGGAMTPTGRGRGVQSYGTTPGVGRGRGEPDLNYRGGRRREFGIGASPRGRGGGAGPAQGSSTLSSLLYQERPFLRPVIFVPSVHTKILFEENDDELLKPVIEDVDEMHHSHAPTADRVFRVFSGHVPPPLSNSEDEDNDDAVEELEEVDFNELGKLFDGSTVATTAKVRKAQLDGMIVDEQEQFTGFYIDTKPSAVMPTMDDDVAQLAQTMEETLSTAEDGPDRIVPQPPAEPSPAWEDSYKPPDNIFYVDTQPEHVPSNMLPQGDLRPSALRDDDDDEVIVYVAPHPKNTKKDDDELEVSMDTTTSDAAQTKEPDTSHFKPYVPIAGLPTIEPSADTGASAASVAFSKLAEASNTPSRLRVPALATPRQAKAFQRKRGVLAAKGKRGGKAKISSFGTFGAMREEALLHLDDHKNDSRREERRKGDSDLEWGDTDDDDFAGVDEVPVGISELLATKLGADVKGKGKAKEESEDDHGMEIDGEMDLEAMQSFVGGLLGNKAGEHLTMGDVEDMERIRKEDEEDEDKDSDDSMSEDDEEEDIEASEEAMIISETLDFQDGEEDDDDEKDEDDDDFDSDDDEDQTPKTSFQARLDRLRKMSANKKTQDESFEGFVYDSDDDDEDILERNLTWAEEDEKYIKQISELLDEGDDLSRRQRKQLFKAVSTGTFEDIEYFSAAVPKKDKGKNLPPDLQAQWEKDREKKAERKKQRELEKLIAAADPFTKKKGGKKGRKAMLAAARLDPTITVIPNRIIDITTLVQQIRRFVDEIGGPHEMKLPPTNKETRKNVHELAIAFGLKSVSKGKGDARYTTLTKTTRTGVRVDEWKISKIVRRSGGQGARGDSFVADVKNRIIKVPRHKEGEIVGHAAPKISETNVGFKLLAMMGWSEGDRIGGMPGSGLEAPLTAVIKHTKLGLGATK